MPRLVPCAVAVLMTTFTILSAQPVPAGPEFQVNAYTTGLQFIPAVGADGAGRFLVLWTSQFQDGSNFGVFGKRFAPDGAPLGAEFQVNTYTTGLQADAQAAFDGSGNFVVAWASYGQDGSYYGVIGRRFDAAGSPLSGEFQANTSTLAWQNMADVAVDASGDFVVVWASQPGYGNPASGIFGRRFDATGVPQGPELQLTAAPSGGEKSPAVAMRDSGDFVVVWMDGDGSATGVTARRFDSAGVPLGGEFQVNTHTPDSQAYPEIAMLGSGEFVVAWQSLNQDGNGAGVFARLFDGAGTPLGGEIQVNTYTSAGQSNPALAMDASGNFVVVWKSDNQDGSGGGIFGRVFESDGVPAGVEFQINTFTAGGQLAPSVAVDAAGNALVAWTSDQDGSSTAIMAQRYACLTATADADRDGVADPCDNCPADRNAGQQDADLDGVGDACDVCPAVPDPMQAQSDGDSPGDACDNCPYTSNANQQDGDGDGVGNACDCFPSLYNPGQQDLDADGIGDPCDNCPAAGNPAQTESDGDGYGDACDCAAADPSAWGLPGPAWSLDVAHDDGTGQTLIVWAAPLDPGASPAGTRYDTLRASDAPDFGAGAVCVESDDGADTAASDSTLPGVNGAFLYWVRVENACGPAAEHAGRTCP